jgi:hypothetical protein
MFRAPAPEDASPAGRPALISCRAIAGNVGAEAHLMEVNDRSMEYTSIFDC